MKKRAGPKIVDMSKKKSHADGVIVRTRTCDVHILVEDNISGDDGQPRVSVEVVSKALPDDKQIRLTVADHTTFAQIHALEDREAPPKREPDPVIPGMEIAGDLTGKYAVLVQKHYPGSLWDRIILCTGGFGCNADGYTRKLFGRYLDGREFQGRRESVWRFATEQEVAIGRAPVAGK